MAGTDQLSAVFSALSDPTRRAIIAELAERDSTVTELTAPLSISMPAVSRHLKVLERAALISRSRSGKWRASRLEAAPLRAAADWIERYRRFWDSSLTRQQAAGPATDATGDPPVAPEHLAHPSEQGWRQAGRHADECPGCCG